MKGLFFFLNLPLRFAIFCFSLINHCTEFILDFYRKHFGTNEQFLITRDLTVIFAVIITIIIIITKIIINNKHPISDLLIFLFSIHKYLKKKGKVELDIESDSQAIMCKKKWNLLVK